MDERELVVLTDKDGQDLLNADGTVRAMDKMEAHRRGFRHRAVSVFVFNRTGDLLIQKRAVGKYHSPGKWTNTCCTHCRPGESPSTTATRRLREEMGMRCALQEVFTFPYHADVGNGLIENEFDHVFIGYSDQHPNPDLAEISEWKWVSTQSLEEDLARTPEEYTYWLRCCFPRVIELKSQKNSRQNSQAPSQLIQLPEMRGKICFIICALSEEYIRSANGFRDKIIHPVVVKAGFSDKIERADVTRSDSNITRVVDDYLVKADLVVADLTGCRPNVFYELGKRHALGGMTVQFTRDPLKGLPFDVRQTRTIHYDLDTARAIEEARRELKEELYAQLAKPLRALPLSPFQVVDRFGVTVLANLVTKEREQYALASDLGRRRCKRIFLMQRSSTLLLGPHREWDDERTFYELLFQQIANGCEFYHIVSLDGITRHFAPDDYPDRSDAQARLVQRDTFVGVNGPEEAWAFKKVPALMHGEDIKPDRQARTFLVELQDGTAEAVLVTDFGGMTASFHLAGRGMLTFLNECIKYYVRCPRLVRQDIEPIK